MCSGIQGQAVQVEVNGLLKAGKQDVRVGGREVRMNEERDGGKGINMIKTDCIIN